MKMTKTTIKNLLKGDYMDALATFATILSDAEDMETALDELDEKVWEVAETAHRTDEWLRLYTALQCGIE